MKKIKQKNKPSPLEGNWAKNQYGALRDIWQGVDTEKELQHSRDEWDKKEEFFHKK